MAIDRDSTIRRAEKLLKQGKLDSAITAYERAVEVQPRDWNTVNILGDLLVKAGRIERAVAQYTRVAEHFAHEGFLQKAAALYKKIAKIRPEDEGVLLQLADLSEQQGLLADAKSCLGTVADHRRRRGDRKGSAEIILRLAALDPSDLSASILAARVTAELGDSAGAVELYKAAGTEYLRRGQPDDGLKALSDAAVLDPADDELRRALMRACIDTGQIDRARRYAATASDAAEVEAAVAAYEGDRARPSLLQRGRGSVPSVRGTSSRRARPTDDGGPAARAQETSSESTAEGATVEAPLVKAERELRAGRYEGGRKTLRALVAEAGVRPASLLSLAEELGGDDLDAAFVCVDVATDALVEADDFAAAASALRAFVRRSPDHVAALMKLVEVSFDGGLEETTREAQADLADAYLAAGRPADARVIAEDLLAREPWQSVHVERLRRALIALDEADPDRIIADHLSGAAPFALTELWHEAGLETAGSPPPGASVEPPPGPSEDAPEEFEIELDFRALAESGAVAEPDGAVEGLFDQLLGVRINGQAPEGHAADKATEPEAAAESRDDSIGVQPSPLLDRPFEELLESVPQSEAGPETTDGPLLPAPVAESEPIAQSLEPAPVAESEPIVESLEPAPVAESEPIVESLEPAPVAESEPIVESLEPAPVAESEPIDEWLAPTSGPDAEPIVESLAPAPGPDAEPIAESLEPAPVAESEPTTEAEDLQEVSFVTPSVEAAESALEPERPEEAVPALSESALDDALLPKQPGIEPWRDGAQPEMPVEARMRPPQVQPTRVWAEPPADELPPAGSGERDLQPLPPPVVDEPLEELVGLEPAGETPAEPAAEETGPPLTPPDSAAAEPALEAPDRGAADGAPELTREIEPLIASQPVVAELAESIEIVEMAPDATEEPESGGTFEPAALDAGVVTPAPVSLETPAEALATGAVVDLSTAIGELRAGIEPAAIEGLAARSDSAPAPTNDLDRVFEMFRDEAAQRGLADMGAQHLKLAAAFREIGMTDESIGALEMAARSPRHRFEASALLAEALRDEGRTREAIEWFERAAEAPAPGAEAGRRLLYELGKTLADVGESERALAVFLELQADAPDYRDVDVRVRRLSTAT